MQKFKTKELFAFEWKESIFIKESLIDKEKRKGRKHGNDSTKVSCTEGRTDINLFVTEAVEL